ncbi:MAG: ABC transporter permease [Chromatiales bacterium]
MRPSLSLPMLVLGTCAVLGLMAPWLPLAPDAISLPKMLTPPSLQAWFGYDELGRDIAARLVHALRNSLTVAVAVVPLSAMLGVLIGMTAAWRGGYTDAACARLMDIFLAFPGILLAIALAGLLGPGIGNVIIALTIVSWVGYARLARAQTHVLREREHVHAARALGTSTADSLRRHVLPLIAAPILVEATLGVAGVMVAEAGLSFLGLGVQPPAASLGAMLRDGAAYMLVAPHMVVAPGIALLTIVLAVNVLGEAMQRRLDPRMAIGRDRSAER